MAKKGKLQKFAEFSQIPFVFENFDPKNPALTNNEGDVVNYNNRWNDFFKNDHPIVLELACGKAEYAIGMAQLYPEKNFIAIDIKGWRMWKGAKKVMAKGLKNVAFLRTRIEQLELFFGENEISEIWITFPDPFLRKSKINRRLTAPNFREKYRKILYPDGTVNLKTDSAELYQFSLESIGEDETVNLIKADDDIYSHDEVPEVLKIKTYYESMHLENELTIKHLVFKF